MIKIVTFLFLFISYCIYSAFVYTSGTAGSGITMNDMAVQGKNLFQKYNCTSCHQIYGLGGYLGPDLTTTMLSPGKREPYVRAILKTGTQRMPDFHLCEEDINSLVGYLNYVTETANSKN